MNLSGKSTRTGRTSGERWLICRHQRRNVILTKLSGNRTETLFRGVSVFFYAKNSQYYDND